MRRIKGKVHFFTACFIQLALLVFGITGVHGQAKLSAVSSSSKVALNNTFQVTYSLSGGSAESFTAPSFAGFSVRGTQKSSGGGMTVIVNGQVVQSGNGEEKWIYTLAPTATGSFTIGPAKVKTGGQWITSPTLNIEVVQASSSQQQQQQQKSQGGGDGTSADDLFIRASVDKSSARQGEQITLTYKIYTRIPVTQYAINKLSSFSGFWTHDLMDANSNPKQYTETFNGSKYTVAEIRKVALFAQKSGKLTIDPLEVECIAQVQVQGAGSVFDKFFNDPFFNDPFFRNSFTSLQNVKKVLRSKPVTVNIAPLPENGKPTPYSGAVGSFRFSAEADRYEAKQNEAITLRYTVTGAGNISLIEMPQPDFPSGFEVYDPQIDDQISIASGQLSGSRTWEYLIIPREAGTFSINPLKFSFFDIKSATYKTIELPAMEFVIARGQGGSAMVSGQQQSEVELINTDIRYMNQSVLPLQRFGWHFFNSPWYYMLMVLIPVLFVVYAVVWRRKLKISSDAGLMRNLRARRLAGKRLKEAQKCLQSGDADLFYLSVARALWGYVADKFNIPLSELSLDNAREILTGKNIPQELLDALTETLNDCEYARFAPVRPETARQELYNKAVSIITRMESGVKR